MRFSLLLLLLAKISMAEIAPIPAPILIPLGEGEVAESTPGELRGNWIGKGGMQDYTVTARSIELINRSIDKDGNKGPFFGQIVPSKDDSMRVMRLPDGRLVSCTITKYSGNGANKHIVSGKIFYFEKPNLVRSLQLRKDGTPHGSLAVYRIE